MSRRTFLIACAVGAAGLAGCSTPLDDPLEPSLGQAVASLQSQIIPAAVSDEAPATSATRSAGAITRYETDKVKQPPVSATSTLKIETGSTGASSGSKP